jgi:division protein CdvB (Snf7/Vps24/ESCRT-III family)
MEQPQEIHNDLSNAIDVVHNQITRLQTLDRKFYEMDVDFRNQIAQNIKLGNNAKAKVLAIELANIHKVQKTTQNMNISLEVVVLRYSTINEFATIMDTINPTIEMIKEIQKDISKVVPTASRLIDDMVKTSSEVLNNYNIHEEFGKITNPMNEDAVKILNQVEEFVEEEAKSRLPEIPVTVTTRSSAEKTSSVEEERKVMIET